MEHQNKSEMMSYTTPPKWHPHVYETPKRQTPFFVDDILSSSRIYNKKNSTISHQEKLILNGVQHNGDVIYGGQRYSPLTEGRGRSLTPSSVHSNNASMTSEENRSESSESSPEPGGKYNNNNNHSLNLDQGQG